MKVIIPQEELEEWFKKYGGTTYITMKEKKDKNWLVNYICVLKTVLNNFMLFWLTHFAFRIRLVQKTFSLFVGDSHLLA